METKTKEEKKQKQGCIMGLVVGSFLLILLASTCFGSDTEEEVAKQRESDRELTVKVLSRQFVEEKLTSPSSAEFSDFKMKKTNDSTYLTMGTVDANNVYGAMLRARYKCTVILRTDSTGVCSYIQLE